MNLFNRIKNLLISGNCFQILGNIVKLYTTNFFYKIFPKLKYNKDKKLHTINNITYINWIDENESGNFWITKFIESRNITHKRCIDFFSVFGPSNLIKYSNNIKIFFTGEHVGRKNSLQKFNGYEDYLLGESDLSIGFKNFKNENYIRFPLRIMQLVDPRMKEGDIKKRIDSINNREIINEKKGFCSLVARHDISGKRTEVYNELSQIGKIDCPSMFMHNIDIYLPDYDSKRRFLKNYRYNICLENEYAKGYVTEKIIDAIRSHTIPIYYGCLNDFDKRIFNEDAILYADNNLYKKVKSLEGNKKEYDKLYKIKPFKDDAYKLISEQLDLLEYKLRSILS